MKKIILLLLLVLVSVTASARKSYITVLVPYLNGSSNYASVNGAEYIYLTGDVPNDIAGFEYVDEPNVYSPGHYWRTHSSRSNNDFKQYSTGEILNVLSEYGYEVESMTPCGIHNNVVLYLLSKEISSGQTISKGDVNEDSEVNIADVNEVISLILGIVREHPEILKQIKD